MSLTVIGIIGFCSLFIFLFLNMPIGLAMATVGFVGLWVIRGTEPGLSVLAVEYFRTASTYVFSVVPLFVAMGFLASEMGVSTDTFKAMDKWIGHIRGGLAMGATGTCAMFAAICGCAIATATSVATVSLPEMRKYGYSDQLSLGVLAAGGNLGFLIPPSLGFIFYGIITEQSIGQLFMAGILPGVLLACLFVVTIWAICRMNPSLATKAPKASWRERLSSLRGIIGILVIIVVVLGGIYAGLVTATEAGALGVFAVLVVGMAKRRFTWKGTATALRTGLQLTGSVFVLIMGAMVFSRFLTVTEIPLQLAQLISGTGIAPFAILWLVLIVYILVGFVMDIMAMILILVPVLHPLLVALGFDPVWLAVVTMLTVLMGHISPPVGIVVYSLHGFVPDVPLFTIFRGALPFLAAMFVCLIILVAFPEISLLIRIL